MPDPDAGREPSSRRDSDPAAGTPRWVKVFGAIALVVAVLLVILMLIGGGRHGPRRHMPSAVSGDSASETGQR